MYRADSQRHGFPRNLGFKAMVEAVHIGHSTTNSTMTENSRDLGAASGERLQKVSKMNFLKVAVKKLNKDGTRVRYFPFRSSSDGWISFRDYESLLEDQTKSETQVSCLESITPSSEARETSYRARFDEAQLDPLPILEQGHVQRIVDSMEGKLAAVQSAEQKHQQGGVSSADIETDWERGLRHRESEPETINGDGLTNIAHNISSFRPLHFSRNVPRSEGTLQKPVAVAKSAGDLSVGQKIMTGAGSIAVDKGDLAEAILLSGSENLESDVNAEEEAGGNFVSSKSQMSALNVNLKHTEAGNNLPRTQQHGSCLRFTKIDKTVQTLKEGQSIEVGDTIGAAPSSAGDGMKLEETTDEGSEKTKMIEKDFSAADIMDSNTSEPITVARVTELDCELRQRSVMMDRAANMPAFQDASHLNEGQMSTTERIRSHGRKRRRRDRLFGLLTLSLHRA